jgi:hypothetical protein
LGHNISKEKILIKENLEAAQEGKLKISELEG